MLGLTTIMLLRNKLNKLFGKLFQIIIYRRAEGGK